MWQSDIFANTSQLQQKFPTKRMLKTWILHIIKLHHQGRVFKRSLSYSLMTKRQKDKKTKIQKYKKTKRQKDKKTKRQKKLKRQKCKKTKWPKREFYIVMSGQFLTLAMFSFDTWQTKLHQRWQKIMQLYLLACPFWQNQFELKKRSNLRGR